jgi:outer membrane protein OmpA-like peptidoglycan-associated protein
MLQSFKSLAFTLAVSALVIPGAANAGESRDVVRDSNGSAVVDSNGNCVRTKWHTKADPCALVNKEARTIYFGFDSAALDGKARAKLNNLISAVKKADSVVGASIVGYADSIGDEAYNENLSKRRAMTVKRYFESRGYLKSEVASVRGLGESSSHSECSYIKDRTKKIACLWRDRRVEIEFDFYQ